MAEITKHEALEYARRNGLMMVDGLPVMPDKDSVPADVWRDMQAVYRALAGGLSYGDPETLRTTSYVDPQDEAD